MAREQDGDQVRGEVSPGGTEGGRRPTGVPPGGRCGAIGPGPALDRAQETRGGAAPPSRRAPGTALPGVGRRALPAGKVADAALAGMEEALKARNGDPLKAELDNAMKRLGELTMENELLWARVRRPGPLAQGGRRNERHGLRRHRQTLRREAGLPDLGAAPVFVLCHRRAAELPVRWPGPANGGRRPPSLTTELLELIRADLPASPFQGEGHRKVWARLRVRDGVKVGRRRVLRLMRENHLLSPIGGGAVTPVSTRGRSSPRRPTSCGAPTAPGSLPWRKAGVGSSWRWSTGTPSAWAGTSANREPGLRPWSPFPRG